MSMGWYLIPRSSMASSRAPTTNRASCLSVSVGTKHTFIPRRRAQSASAASRGPTRTLTSVGVGELGAAQEAQVARPGPDRLRVAEAQPGVEVVRLQHLLAVAAVVAAAVVGAVHPDLQGRRVRSLPRKNTQLKSLMRRRRSCRSRAVVLIPVFCVENHFYINLRWQAK